MRLGYMLAIDTQPREQKRSKYKRKIKGEVVYMNHSYFTVNVETKEKEHYKESFLFEDIRNGYITVKTIAM